jgi:hypothetical protein
MCIAIIAILEYCTSIPEMSTWFLTLVALSLPLSSLWAAHNIESTRSSAASRKRIVATASFGSGSSRKPANLLISAMSEKSATLLDTPVSMVPLSSLGKDGLGDDLEAGRNGSGDVPVM